jgi:FkbH-like protein
MPAEPSPEAIKLIIWDPDETLWQGRLADGAIKAISANQDAVIELCRRGILSSVCARSDFDPMQRLLRTFGLWDFFLFPSVDWSPKPARIERIIAAMNVSPSAVLVIDDNGANLAAVRARIPGLQVAGPDILATILTDPRCTGADDPGLIRFSRYKLLEQQKSDVAVGPENGNDDFLRSSGVVATIEYDVAGNIDRAVDLVNRTSRFNFTRSRLPGEPAAARQALLDAIANGRAGLIRVSDNYDDHGLCGFYLIRGEGPSQTLDHFCFSARIAGMGIESWLYGKIGRPAYSGDLPAFLPVDWINTGAAAESPDVPDVPEIVVRGGAEIDAIARYCHLNCGNVRIEGNRREWHVVLGQNSTTNLMLSLHKQSPEALRELHVIGFREPDLASRFWAVAPDGIGILSLQGDRDSPRYRHRDSGLEVAFQFDLLPADFTRVTDQHFADFAKAKDLTVETAGHVRQFVDYFAQSYELMPPQIEIARLRASLHAIFAAFPWSARLFVLLPSAEQQEGARAYNDLVRAVAAAYSHIEVIEPGDFADQAGSAADQPNRAMSLQIYRTIMERNAAARAETWR